MKKYTILLLSIIMTISCDDILEQELVGKRTDQDYWTTEADMVDALAGAYGQWATRALGMHDLFFDNQGDDHWRAGDHAEDEEIETFNTNPSNYKLRDTYRYKYEVISSANGILINGPKVKELGAISETSYNAYYRLYLIHGQVPIITEENVLTNEYNVPKCESPEILSDFILSDLENAVALLPMHNVPGSVGKGAAWAVMTSIYMHRAEDYGNAEFLNKAIAAGQNVVDNYPLADDYLSLFREGNQYLKENLFIMMNDLDWINQRIMSKHRGPRPWGMYGFQEPLDDLVNEFEDGDVRKGVTIICDGEFALQGSFRLNGAGARDDLINAVRLRTGLGDVSGADIDDLIHETRVELAGENFRYQNLLRWHKAGIYDLEEFLSRPEKMIPSDVGRKVWSGPKNFYQPLYQTDIDNSDGVLVQNPEWIN